MRLFKISEEYYTPLKQVEINMIQLEKMNYSLANSSFIFLAPPAGIEPTTSP